MFDANLQGGTITVSAVSADAPSAAMQINGFPKGRAAYVYFVSIGNVSTVSGTGYITPVVQVSPDSVTWYDHTVLAGGTIGVTSTPGEIEPFYAPITTDSEYIRGVLRTGPGGTISGTFNCLFSMSKV